MYAIVDKGTVPWQVWVLWIWSRAERSMQMQSVLLYKDVLLTDHCIQVCYSGEGYGSLASWVDVFRNAHDTCPNVHQLMDLLLSLPASGADREGGFRLTKVMSDWRSRLRYTMVTDWWLYSCTVLQLLTLTPHHLPLDGKGPANAGYL